MATGNSPEEGESGRRQGEMRSHGNEQSEKWEKADESAILGDYRREFRVCMHFVIQLQFIIASLALRALAKRIGQSFTPSRAFRHRRDCVSV